MINPNNSVTITFGKGPTGLEFEPILLSGNSQLGCRVVKKSQCVEGPAANVRVGDIVEQVGKCQTLTMPFQQILELLQSSEKEAKTTVVFKCLADEWDVKSPAKEVECEEYPKLKKITHDDSLPEYYDGPSPNHSTSEDCINASPYLKELDVEQKKDMHEGQDGETELFHSDDSDHIDLMSPKSCKAPESLLGDISPVVPSKDEQFQVHQVSIADLSLKNDLLIESMDGERDSQDLTDEQQMITNLLSEKVKLLEENARLKEMFNSASKEIGNKDDVIDSSACYSDEHGNVGVKENEISDSSLKLQELQSALAQEREERVTLEGQREVLTQQLRQMQSHLASASDMLARTSDQNQLIEDLQERLAEAEARGEANNKKVGDKISKEMAELNQSLNRSMDAISEANMSGVLNESFNGEVTSVKERVTDLCEKVESLEKEIALKDGRLILAEQVMAEKDKLITHLQEEYECMERAALEDRAQSHKELAALDSINKKLQEENMDGKATFGKMMDDLDIICQERDLKTKELEEMAKKMESLKQEEELVEKMTEDIHCLELRIEQQEGDKRLLLAQNKEMEMKCSENKQELSALHDQLDILDAEKLKSAEQQEALKLEIERLEIEIKTQQVLAAGSLGVDDNDGLSFLQDRLEEKTASIKKLTSMLNDSREQVKKLQFELEDYKEKTTTELNTTRNESILALGNSEKLADELGEAKEALQLYMELGEEAREKAEVIYGKLISSQKQYNKEMSSLKRKHKIEQERLEEVQKQHDRTKEKVANLQKELLEKSEQCTGLIDKFKSKTKEATEMSVKIAKLEKAKDDLKRQQEIEVSQLKKQINTLSDRTGELNVLKEENKGYQAHIISLQQQHAREKRAQLASTKRIEDMKIALMLAAEELEAFHGEGEEVRLSLETIQKQRDQLTKDKEMLQAQLEKARKEVDENKTSYGKLKEEQKAVNDKQEQKIAELQRQIKDLSDRQTKNDDKQQIALLEKHEILQAQLEKARKEVEESKNSYDKLKEEQKAVNDKQEQKIVELQSQIKDLSDRQQTKNHYKQQISLVDKQKAEINELKKTNEKLQKQLNTVQRQASKGPQLQHQVDKEQSTHGNKQEVQAIKTNDNQSKDTESAISLPANPDLQAVPENHVTRSESKQSQPNVCERINPESVVAQPEVKRSLSTSRERPVPDNAVARPEMKRSQSNPRERPGACKKVSDGSQKGAIGNTSTDPIISGKRNTPHQEHLQKESAEKPVKSDPEAMQKANTKTRASKPPVRRTSTTNNLPPKPNSKRPAGARPSSQPRQETQSSRLSSRSIKRPKSNPSMKKSTGDDPTSANVKEAPKSQGSGTTLAPTLVDLPPYLAASMTAKTPKSGGTDDKTKSQKVDARKPRKKPTLKGAAAKIQAKNKLLSSWK